ncbi:MAG: thiosulfate oxidation carrier complex protein SoxZ [Betaproteobacteria bacterium TMED41]|nr:MAG: thiosulfate oxidation carrier complex protein SoxZ [Betaproteobacteria bacterium TMED41]|tara:strand:- start:29 stop:343 length:315 start_codon:yes stop_codon:yes gene_type:complete
MTKATKIRAKIKNNLIDFRMLMHHEMESGLRKDETSGEVIPAWFIQEFTINLNGEKVISGYLGPTISKNPYLRCKMQGQAGDSIIVKWIDNKGQNREDVAIVKA